MSENLKLSMDDLNRKSVDEFKAAEKIPVIAVLENIRSAYNVGSVFRTADAFLLQAVYLTGYTAFPPHKEIKKTALGAEDSVDWKHFTNAAAAMELLRSGVIKSLLLNRPLTVLNCMKNNLSPAKRLQLFSATR